MVFKPGAATEGRPYDQEVELEAEEAFVIDELE
jgi:hypothetical protein